MSYAIEVEDLHKYFGDVKALNGCSFRVRENEVFGLIGPNGAGKTTTLRVLGTLLKPTSGKVEVFGYDVVRSPEVVRGLLSYLPEEAGAYQQLSGDEYLEFMAGFYARDRAEGEKMVQEGREISGLGDRLRDRVKDYSKGMKRRLQVARSLMMEPRLAILDEPTSGLDVIHAYYVRQLIKDYADKKGVTVLLSSHNMLEVEYLCHRVALINEGVVVAEGAPEDLKGKYGAKNLEQVFMKVTRLG